MNYDSVLNKVLKKKNKEPIVNGVVLRELNAKQKLALECYARGMSQVDCALEAGYNIDPNSQRCSIISRLVHSPEGKKYLEEIRQIKRDEAKDISDMIVKRWVDQANFCLTDVIDTETYEVEIDKDSGTKIKKTNAFLKVAKLSDLPRSVVQCITEFSTKNGELVIKCDSSKALDNLAKLVNIFDNATQEDLKKAFANAGLLNRPDNISDTDDSEDEDL